ncbi:hypothetical protein [Natronorubrum bangense]|uniref:Uncharacterized protein n=2 Tax=Natronorubrum bangense TaxID=61858 RepID=A0A4D6HPN4_9EURY|nr:hypothetical protein [Natronorubrum bangense]QCC55198.1 hypothetical protein DV706_12390 [Natronorubrum bangense]
MVDVNRFQFVVVFGIALLGIGLVFNPFYLYPNGGGEWERTYHVTPIENETMASQALGLSEEVLGCPSDRPCVLEQQILEDGSVESDVPVYGDDSPWYSVVRTANGTYVPERGVEDNETVLTLEEVTAMEAVEEIAVPSDERPEEVREAVTTGSVTVYSETVETFERNEVLEHDGEYYYQTRTRGSSHWTGDGSLAQVRALLFLIGGGLVAYAGWRFKELSD